MLHALSELVRQRAVFLFVFWPNVPVAMLVIADESLAYSFGDDKELKPDQLREEEQLLAA